MGMGFLAGDGAVAFKVAYDRESGYIGHKVSGEEFKVECTKFDKILLVFKDGTYKVSELPEETRLPSGVRGPVERWALAWLAVIWAGVAIQFLSPGR